MHAPRHKRRTSLKLLPINKLNGGAAIQRRSGFWAKSRNAARRIRDFTHFREALTTGST